MVAAVGWARCRTSVRVTGARCVMVRAAVLISAARCLGRIARLTAQAAVPTIIPWPLTHPDPRRDRPRRTGIPRQQIRDAVTSRAGDADRRAPRATVEP